MSDELQFQDEPADPRKYLPPVGCDHGPEVLCDNCMEATFNESTTERDEWDVNTLQEDFEVLGFQAPYVVVRRRSDGQKGSLMLDNAPRRYHDFEPHCDMGE